MSKASRKHSRVGTPRDRAATFERLLTLLCTRIGPHPSGTRAYERVARTLHRELSRALPEAHLDPYLDFWATVPHPEILHQGRRLPALVAENCAGTGAAGFTGVIVRSDRPGVPYGIQDRRTGQVAAHIGVSPEVSALPEYLVGDDVLSLPRFVVGLREVPYVELLVEDGAVVQVRCRVVHAPPVPTHNVVGRLPGASPEEILVLAHADSVIQTEGANDNTATAILTTMLALSCAASTPARTLTFVITGSEEYGCLGARHYVRRRQVEGTAGRIRFVVNSDSLTYGPNLWVTTTDRELLDLVRQIHLDLGLSTTPIYSAEAPWMNDAAPCRDLNPRVRGINFNSRGYETLAANHTPADDAANVPRDCAETSFLVLRELIARLQEL